MRSMIGFACAVGLAAVIIGCETACAGEWVMPLDGAVVCMPFGVAYAGGVHRGIDLSAEQGAQVRAPAGGTVVFAGVIPADGGGTCNAVTVQTADGLKISLLPLDAVYVQEGAAVAGGDAVGRLAPAGDDSTDAPHLHLGLRQQDRYIDPASMLPDQVVPDSEPAVVTDAPAEVPAGGEPPGIEEGAPAPEYLPTSEPASGVTPLTDHARTPGQVTANAEARLTAVIPTAPEAIAPMEMTLPEVAVPEAESASKPIENTAEAAQPVTPALVTSRLVRDAGAVQHASGSRATETGPAASGSRWVSARSHGARIPTIPASVGYAIASMTAAMTGIIGIIARSKAAARVR